MNIVKDITYTLSFAS